MRFPSLVEPPSKFLEDLLASAPPGELISSIRRAGQPEPAHGSQPANQKKKRVRREVRELKYLREQAHILELRLAQLKKRAPAHSGLSPALPTSHDASAQSIWEGIAERQLEERLCVEKAQRELSAACAGTAKLVLDLTKQLKSWAKDMRLSALMRQKPALLWDFGSADAAGVFADQLTQASKTYFKMQQQCLVPVTALQPTADLVQGTEIVRTDPNVDTGVVLEMCCSTTIPFDLRVAGRAYWSMSTYEAYRRQGSVCTTGRIKHSAAFNSHSNRYLCQDVDTDSDVVSSPFALQVNCEGFTANVRGMQTCRRYIGEDSETIVWAGYADPVAFNGITFPGMHCRKTGWIKLQRAAGQETPSTVVEMYSEMTPVFKDGVENQNWQIRALVDSMARAHNTTNTIYCEMIRELLLEEDWKATFGSGNHLT